MTVMYHLSPPPDTAVARATGGGRRSRFVTNPVGIPKKQWSEVYQKTMERVYLHLASDGVEGRSPCLLDDACSCT